MFKNICLILTLLLTSAISFAQGFDVTNYTVDIYLQNEGYFDVVEKYDIEFKESKHGIFRDIIIQNKFKDENGEISNREIYISNIDVPGHIFTSTGALIQKFSDKTSIRIGDKNKLVTGQQSYEIRYRVKNALIFTDDLVQLYWNLKPSDWKALFSKVNFTIHAPRGAMFSPENSFVYSGDQGISTPSIEFDYNYSDSTFSGNSKEDFLSRPGQNVTVLVKLPKSLIQEVDFTPPFWKRYGWLTIIIIIFLITVVYLRKRWGNNNVIAVTSYYPPEGIDPAMAGVLIDNSSDSRDIISLLPYWGTKGIIKMEEIQKKKGAFIGDLKLIKLKDIPSDAPDYANKLFNKIFTSGTDEVLTSSLRGIISEPKRMLSEESEQYYLNSKGNGWFRGIVTILSLIWAFSSITFVPFLLRSYIDIESTQFILAIVFNFLFFFIVFPIGFAFIATKIKEKNNKGKNIMPELLGFQRFIKLAEVGRIKELLKNDPTYFEKTMPYAVAFNLLKEWTNKFDGLNMQSPTWYSSSTGSMFAMSSFATSLSNSISAASTSMVSSPSGGGSSSSGGGSSGGGFGGGGGGSW